MDPLTASTTFSTLIGLLSLFKQERKAREDQNSAVFIKWLEEHRHEQIRDLILHSQQLSEEIEKALSEDREIILAKLSKIDEILATLLNRVESVSGIANLLQPNFGLSDQAVSILGQLVRSKAKEFGLIKTMSKIGLTLIPGGWMKVDEERFIEDDLKTLVDLNLLSVRYGSQSGSPFYGITRNALKLIEAIEGK